MKRLAFVLMIVFSIAISGPWALAIEKEPGDISELIEEEIWIIFAHDPAGYLHDAWENFLNGNLWDAAYNIRKTKALLKLEAARAEKEARDDLTASIRQLEGLITSLEAGTAPTSKALRQAFAQTEYALSNHHYHKALHYKAKGDYDKMTYALDAAATHLLHRSTWADLKLDPNDALAAKEARSLARKAKRGEKWLPGKLREAIEGIGRGIRSLGERLKQTNEGS
jgi:hypothetical protein